MEKTHPPVPLPGRVARSHSLHLPEGRSGGPAKKEPQASRGGGLCRLIKATYWHYLESQFVPWKMGTVVPVFYGVMSHFPSPRAPVPSPQVRWSSTPLAPTPVPSSKRRWAVRSPNGKVEVLWSVQVYRWSPEDMAGALGNVGNMIIPMVFCWGSASSMIYGLAVLNGWQLSQTLLSLFSANLRVDVPMFMPLGDASFIFFSSD